VLAGCTACSHGEHTRAVHPPRAARAADADGPAGLPHGGVLVRQRAAVRRPAGRRRPGYSYSRVDNPTSDAFAQAVAALEGVGLDREVVGQPFASGMAAISTVLMTLASTGAHVVAPRELYGGTYALLTGVLQRFGVSTTFVDGTDLEAVRAAVRPETAVVWAETLANPTLSVADLPGLAGIAHDAGAHLVVDATFTSPAVVRPLEHGVDVVVQSATKYLGGHSDSTGGVAVGAPELMARVRTDRVDLGGHARARRGLPAPPRPGHAARCAWTGTAAARSSSPPRSRSTRGSCGSTTRGCRRTATTRSRGKLFDAGRYGGVVTVTPEAAARPGHGAVRPAPPRGQSPRRWPARTAR
jgi:hypothetical protein